MNTNWEILHDDNNNYIIELEKSNFLAFDIIVKDDIIEDNNNTQIVENLSIENDYMQYLTTSNDILKIKYDNSYNALDIIEMQQKVIGLLSRHYKLYRLDDIQFYIKYFLWLYKSSEYLALLIKQPINRNKSNNLMRSSYKFCNKKSDCHSQYGFLFNKKSKCCVNDHYVHHKIVSDIENLLNYISNHYETGKNNITLELELRKGIETISYVINHMFQELSSFTLYFDNKNKKKYNIKDFYKYHF